MTFNLFIGANNKTKQLELKKIEELLNKRHEGYTIVRTAGAWRGLVEQSCMVIISEVTEQEAITTAKLIRQALNQEAVGIQQAPELSFV